MVVLFVRKTLFNFYGLNMRNGMLFFTVMTVNGKSVSHSLPGPSFFAGQKLETTRQNYNSFQDFVRRFLFV